MNLNPKIILGAIALLVALSIGGNIIHNIEANSAQAEAEAARAAKAKLVQEKRDALMTEFHGNRSALISESQQAISQGDPATAQKALSKFASLDDPDVKHLLQVAGDRLQAAQTIKKLSDELTNKPDKVRALAIYTELARLEPSNPLWRALIEENTPIVAAIKARLAAAEKVAARKDAVKRLFSVSDGSVYAVEVGIKARLKDPDSYKHVETRASDPGVGDVTVFTQYRARNSFNAVVPGLATAVVSPSGELVSLELHK
ncbi:MAG TPA: hypothetical protein PLB25_16160 [Rhodoferax sp.]|nr:hypothetical protein [Rhodoferax sp.]